MVGLRHVSVESESLIYKFLTPITFKLKIIKLHWCITGSLMKMLKSNEVFGNWRYTHYQFISTVPLEKN